MNMLIGARLLVAAFALLGMQGATRPDLVRSGTDSWIEVVEAYEVPADPDWRQSALDAAASLRASKRKDLLIDPVKGASKRAAAKRKLDAANRELESEADSLERTANSVRSLTVIRAWDGIARRRLSFVMGARQSTLVSRLQPKSIVHVDVGSSSVPDHLQAQGRTTVLALADGQSTPTDFLRAEDGDESLFDSEFGQVDIGVLGLKQVYGVATKHSEAGSGVIDVAIKLPERLPLDVSLPWYCEFKLLELAKDGSVAREVKFKGAKWAVAMRGPAAVARIEVTNPQPFGYAVEAIGWYGVGPRSSMLKQSTPAAPVGAPAGSDPAAPSSVETAPESAPPPKIPGGLAPPIPGGTPRPSAPPLPRPPDSPIPPPEPIEPQP